MPAPSGCDGLSNAMRVPSGDQAGLWLSAGPIGVAVPPLALITMIVPLISNAICTPSGDQAGLLAALPKNRLRNSLPSAFMTATPPPKSTLIRKAILVASGDQDGSDSRSPLFVRSVSPEQLGATTNTSSSQASVDCANAMADPSGANDGRMLMSSSWVTRVWWVPSEFMV